LQRRNHSSPPTRAASKEFLATPDPPLGHLMNRKRAILVVDDDADHRQLVLKILTRAIPSANVLQAASAKDALRALEAQPIDVILCDQFMPGQTGIEFMRVSKARFPATRLLLLTGTPRLSTQVEALKDVQVDAYLRKPVEPHQLVTSIQQSLAAAGWPDTDSRLPGDS
jgi:CheY-like chemotaxis protein